jgi:glutamate-5-semialdehyde dehydrogenase
MEAAPKSTSSERVLDLARKAKAASRSMAALSAADKNAFLSRVALALQDRSDEILSANAEDVAAARLLVESGRISEPAFKRLKLDLPKLREIVSGVEQVAAMEDPVGKSTLETELDDGLTLCRVNCPIGVIGVIFESRPDALVQISALAIKSGNAVILKGGAEAEHSNRKLFAILRDAAIAVAVSPECLQLLENREDVRSLLSADAYVDLIVPRGSNQLVRYVQENTLIPVLGHAEGLCHIYVDRAADLTKALDVVIDAKTTYPAACNSVETVLVHKEIAPGFLPAVVEKLQSQNVEVRCEQQWIDRLHLQGVNAATEQDWGTEYCDLILSIRVVDGLDEAIDHINTYSSHHTEAIITEDAAAFERFFAAVDSAGVYLNASTRFADGYRYGFGAELGISTSKLHPRGPVGLDGLVTYKYKLVGNGQTVAMYSGKDARSFKHLAKPDAPGRNR